VANIDAGQQAGDSGREEFRRGEAVAKTAWCAKHADRFCGAFSKK